MARRSPSRFLWVAALLALAMLGIQAWQERHVPSTVPTQDSGSHSRSDGGKPAPSVPGLPADCHADGAAERCCTESTR
jgi:hypothetical protein